MTTRRPRGALSPSALHADVERTLLASSLAAEQRRWRRFSLRRARCESSLAASAAAHQRRPVHQRVQSPAPPVFACPACAKAFESDACLWQHWRRRHATAAPPPTPPRGDAAVAGGSSLLPPAAVPPAAPDPALASLVHELGALRRQLASTLTAAPSTTPPTAGGGDAADVGRGGGDAALLATTPTERALRRELDGLRELGERRACERDQLLLDVAAASQQALARLQAQVDALRAVAGGVASPRAAAPPPHDPRAPHALSGGCPLEAPLWRGQSERPVAAAAADQARATPTLLARAAPEAPGAAPTDGGREWRATVARLQRELTAAKAGHADASRRAAALGAATAAMRALAASGILQQQQQQRQQGLELLDGLTLVVPRRLARWALPAATETAGGAGGAGPLPSSFRLSYQWQRLPPSLAAWAGSANCASLLDAALEQGAGPAWASLLPAETAVSDTCPVRVRVPPAWELVLAVPLAPPCSAASAGGSGGEPSADLAWARSGTGPAHVTATVHRTMTLRELRNCIADQLGLPEGTAAVRVVSFAAGSTSGRGGVSGGLVALDDTATVEEAGLFCQRPVLSWLPARSSLPHPPSSSSAAQGRVDALLAARARLAAPLLRPPAAATAASEARLLVASSRSSPRAAMRSNPPPASAARASAEARVGPSPPLLPLLNEGGRPQASCSPLAAGAGTALPLLDAGCADTSDAAVAASSTTRVARGRLDARGAAVASAAALTSSAPSLAPSAGAAASAAGAAAHLAAASRPDGDATAAAPAPGDGIGVPAAAPAATPAATASSMEPGVTPATVRPHKVAALRRSISRSIRDVLDVLVRSGSSVAGASSVRSASSVRGDGGGTLHSRRGSSAHAFAALPADATARVVPLLPTAAGTATADCTAVPQVAAALLLLPRCSAPDDDCARTATLVGEPSSPRADSARSARAVVTAATAFAEQSPPASPVVRHAAHPAIASFVAAAPRPTTPRAAASDTVQQQQQQQQQAMDRAITEISALSEPDLCGDGDDGRSGLVSALTASGWLSGDGDEHEERDEPDGPKEARVHEKGEAEEDDGTASVVDYGRSSSASDTGDEAEERLGPALSGRVDAQHSAFGFAPTRVAQLELALEPPPPVGGTSPIAASAAAPAPLASGSSSEPIRQELSRGTPRQPSFTDMTLEFDLGDGVHDVGAAAADDDDHAQLLLRMGEGAEVLPIHDECGNESAAMCALEQEGASLEHTAYTYEDVDGGYLDDEAPVDVPATAPLHPPGGGPAPPAFTGSFVRTPPLEPCAQMPPGDARPKTARAVLG